MNFLFLDFIASYICQFFSFKGHVIIFYMLHMNFIDVQFSRKTWMSTSHPKPNNKGLPTSVNQDPHMTQIAIRRHAVCLHALSVVLCPLGFVRPHALSIMFCPSPCLSCSVRQHASSVILCSSCSIHCALFVSMLCPSTVPFLWQKRRNRTVPLIERSYPRVYLTKPSLCNNYFLYHRNLRRKNLAVWSTTEYTSGLFYPHSIRIGCTWTVYYDQWLQTSLTFKTSMYAFQSMISTPITRRKNLCACTRLKIFLFDT